MRLARGKRATVSWRAPRTASYHLLSVLKPGLSDANFDNFIGRRSNFAVRYAEVSETTYAGQVRFNTAKAGRYVVWIREVCPALCDDRAQPYSFRVRVGNVRR